MKHLRKRKFVDTVVQGGIVARLLAYWAATIAACIGLGTLFGYFGDPFTPISEQVVKQLQALAPFLTAVVLLLPICILHLIRFTHRFAGPVVRLRRRLDELAAGEAGDELRFRDGDYWQDLAEAFNRVRASHPACPQAEPLPTVVIPFVGSAHRQEAEHHV